MRMRIRVSSLSVKSNAGKNRSVLLRVLPCAVMDLAWEEEWSVAGLNELREEECSLKRLDILQEMSQK